MKQKIVIKIFMNGEETKKKALKVAVSFRGVESAKGDKDKGQIEVEGEGIDPVKLLTRLRRKLAGKTFMDKLTLRFLCCNSEFAELISVEEKKDKPKEENKEANKIEAEPVWTHGDNVNDYVPPPICHVVVRDYYTPGCFF